MGKHYLILIRNQTIVYAAGSLDPIGRFVQQCQDRLGCLSVNVNPRIISNMVQSPWGGQGWQTKR